MYAFDPQQIVPRPGEAIAWPEIMTGPLGAHMTAMAQTPQDALLHGEGDVLTHTRMVCEALVRMEAWRALDAPGRQALFLAALLHDVGKPRCTRQEGGRVTSPRHGVVGAHIVRALLWREGGLCGEADKMALRETVCALIRHHGDPPHLFDSPDARVRTLRVAALGELARGFSLHLLITLAEADILGRECPDRAALRERVALFGLLAGELGCLERLFAFPSAFSRFACLSGRAVAPGQPLFDDTWGEALVMCALPGTGKDTYLAAHAPDLPMVSPDIIRRRMGISPAAPQGRVIAQAQEEARAYLRRRQPFAWNATCLTETARRAVVGLCARYGASVRVQYLETEWNRQARQNEGRKHVVPPDVMARMLSQLSPPTPQEAHRVDWRCL